MLHSEMFELGMMLRATFKSPLMELLAIRLGSQKTTAKSLVMPPFFTQKVQEPLRGKVGYLRTRNVPHFEKGGLGGICRGINTATMP